MIDHPLNFNTRKALCVHLGEEAGRHLAELVLHMAKRIDTLEREKVDVTPVVPANSRSVAIGRDSFN